MKFTQTSPAFRPLTVTFETQEEIDLLAQALYHDSNWFSSDNLPKELRMALIGFRAELHDYSSEGVKSI